jgi:hypothetical protein
MLFPVIRAGAVAGRTPALPAGRPSGSDRCATEKEGASGGTMGSPALNDHGPLPGTRDRPSDTGSAARLAAAARTCILRDPAHNVQSELQVSD